MMRSFLTIFHSFYSSTSIDRCSKVGTFNPYYICLLWNVSSEWMVNCHLVAIFTRPRWKIFSTKTVTQWIFHLWIMKMPRCKISIHRYWGMTEHLLFIYMYTVYPIIPKVTMFNKLAYICHILYLHTRKKMRIKREKKPSPCSTNVPLLKIM